MATGARVEVDFDALIDVIAAARMQMEEWYSKARTCDCGQAKCSYLRMAEETECALLRLTAANSPMRLVA